MELVILTVGAAIGWLSSRHVQFSHSRLERTLELADEFNSREMLLNRQSLWTQHAKELFRDQNFDQRISSINSGEFDAEHLLFRFIHVAWFFRKVAILARLNLINRRECRGLLGAQFEMYWTHIFARAMRRYSPNDMHVLLWKDLESLIWLREGFSSPHLVSLFSEVERGTAPVDCA